MKNLQKLLEDYDLSLAALTLLEDMAWSGISTYEKGLIDLEKKLRSFEGGEDDVDVPLSQRDLLKILATLNAAIGTINVKAIKKQREEILATLGATGVQKTETGDQDSGDQDSGDEDGDRDGGQDFFPPFSNN